MLCGQSLGLTKDVGMMKTENNKESCLQMDSVEHKEYAEAYRNGNTRKDCWAIAGSGILQHTITNERLARRGYYDISEAYKSMHSI